MTIWHQLDIPQTLETTNTNAETGLTSDEAVARLLQNGKNELTEGEKRRPFDIIFDQMKEPMVIVLLVAALVSGLLGEFIDVTVILLIVILNAVIGFMQEYRAEQAIAALKKMSVPTVHVRRNGRLQDVSAVDLVVGDIVVLETGNTIPADCRVVESVNLKVQESALTGESEAVEKDEDALSEANLTVGDRTNMLFMGTAVTYGRGTAVVVETGMDTQLGHIAHLLQSVDEELTPLQQRLGRLGIQLAWVALVIVLLIVAIGFFNRNPEELLSDTLKELFLTGVSMAVAAVPEGLAAVVTITLALGSQRMLKRRALIRKLPAVETLGSVTTICSDKTGTLTQNRMTVTTFDVVGKVEAVDTLLSSKGIMMDAEFDEAQPPTTRTTSLLIKAAALCNDAFYETDETGQQHVIGDPTEGALIVAAQQLGRDLQELKEGLPRVREIPFSSETKRMVTIHEMTDRGETIGRIDQSSTHAAFAKGAMDSIFDICDRIWTGVSGEMLPLDDEMKARVQAGHDRLANQGQRVLGVSFKPLNGVDDSAESGHIMIGLVGMIDPPRPEVKEAVMLARRAGIRPIMITGDHPLTAHYIATELGIAEENGRVLTGRQLSQMSAAELMSVVGEVNVYARVSPQHKLDIVDALQTKGEVVAMTGDGVNDAPALRRANIGVAMGITGTDVSKEASDMVLLDDNFATIVAAIEEGRTIYDNIVKFVKYTLSSNTGELLVMFVAPFLGMPLPLLPLQILWINLVTDGLPGLALAIEDKEPGIMERKPFDSQDSIFAHGVWQQIAWVGGLMGLVSLIVGLFYYNADPDGVWRTMVFTTLVLGQMGNALAIRATTQSVFRVGIFANKLMIGAIALTVALQMALLYLPFLQKIFGTEPLNGRDLAIALAASTIVFFAVEFGKWVARRQNNN